MPVDAKPEYITVSEAVRRYGAEYDFSDKDLRNWIWYGKLKKYTRGTARAVYIDVNELLEKVRIRPANSDK